MSSTEFTSDVFPRQETLLTAGPSETVGDVAIRMSQYRVGSLVVVDAAGRMVGILTERDCLNHLASSQSELRLTRVDQIMTTDVISASASTPLGEVSQIMISRRIRHLPIVVDGRPVRMLSSRDVLSHQLRLTREMAAAAEQTARLVKGLKSLNVEDVIQVIHEQVPEMFAAQRWTLRMPGDQDGEMAGQPLRSRCDCPDEDRWLQGCSMGEPMLSAPCGHCPQGGICIRLPLAPAEDPQAQDQAGSLLCMCGIDGVEASRDILFYKASLLQEVLGATLANARLYQGVRKESLTDPLTGANSRRAWEATLADASQHATRYGRPYSLAILDIDHFKAINDAHGHALGDQVLRQFAELLRTGIRHSDTCARYGGDEFVILLPEVVLPQARVALDRIRAQAATRLLLPDGQPITFSCGMAQWCPEGDESSDSVMPRADAELYEAKRAGRNCTRPEILVAEATS